MASGDLYSDTLMTSVGSHVAPGAPDLAAPTAIVDSHMVTVATDLAALTTVVGSHVAQVPLTQLH